MDCAWTASPGPVPTDGNREENCGGSSRRSMLDRVSAEERERPSTNSAPPREKVENNSSPRFADVLQDHVQELQSSLASLCESIDADLTVPYPLSKRLGIDKNLTWKAARILQAGDPSEALKHLPGKGGRELFLEAFRRAGAPPSTVEAVADAVQALEQTVHRHIDDKATLELVLDGIPSDRGEMLETSRRLAFRGNSGIWGVQARTRLTTSFLAPNADDPETVDLTLVAGFQRFRRLREETPWPILKLRTFTRDGKPLPMQNIEPLDPAHAFGAGPSLLPEFSTAPQASIHTYESRSHRVFELAPGPVGNPGAEDIVFGQRMRGFAPVYGTRPTDVAEHQSDIDLPVEHLLFTLFVHKDLPLARQPRFQLLGRLGREVGPHETRRDADCLPIREDIVGLQPTERDLETELFPRFYQLAGSTASACGWDLADFRVLRVTMTHPPAPSTAVIVHELGQR